jgi:hypothetical protein
MPTRKPAHRHDPLPAPTPVAPEDLLALERSHGVDPQPLASPRGTERADEEGAALDAPQEALEGIEAVDDIESAEVAEQGEASVGSVGPQGMDEPEAET